MDNAGKLIPELLKGLLYLVFVFPFVWIWRQVRPKPDGYDGTYVEDHCSECSEYLSECTCDEEAGGAGDG